MIYQTIYEQSNRVPKCDVTKMKIFEISILIFQISIPDMNRKSSEKVNFKFHENRLKKGLRYEQVNII